MMERYKIDELEIDRILSLISELIGMDMPDAAAWLLIDAAVFGDSDIAVREAIADRTHELLREKTSVSTSNRNDVQIMHPASQWQALTAAIQRALLAVELRNEAIRGEQAISLRSPHIASDVRAMFEAGKGKRWPNSALELAMQFLDGSEGESARYLDHQKTNLREISSDWPRANVPRRVSPGGGNSWPASCALRGATSIHLTRGQNR
jgi:hypothetical protein